MAMWQCGNVAVVAVCVCGGGSGGLGVCGGCGMGGDGGRVGMGAESVEQGECVCVFVVCVRGGLVCCVVGV